VVGGVKATSVAHAKVMMGAQWKKKCLCVNVDIPQDAYVSTFAEGGPLYDGPFERNDVGLNLDMSVETMSLMYPLCVSRQTTDPKIQSTREGLFISKLDL
jgi:hypothetical protein